MMGCYSGNVFSARDELTHVKLALALFNIIKAEYPKAWTDEVKEDCRNSIISAAKNELNYATFVMGGVDLPELKLEDVWRYIKYITNARLKDAGLRQYFKVYELPRESRWFEEALHGTGHGNFFEVRNNEYSMTGFVGEIDWGVKPKEE
jgi:ribonucleotide reductase beta subunit family protein with ferritin-like domain